MIEIVWSPHKAFSLRYMFIFIINIFFVPLDFKQAEIS